MDNGQLMSYDQDTIKHVGEAQGWIASFQEVETLGVEVPGIQEALSDS